MEKKSEAYKIINYLILNGVRCFYHFTHVDNIASIEKHGGLYAWAICEDKGIQIPYSGGNDYSRRLDVSKGLQSYVRLSFSKYHPMGFKLFKELSVDARSAPLVMLEVDIRVAEWRDTLFSNMNAAASKMRFGHSYADLQRVNISATQLPPTPKKDALYGERQAEVMVRHFVPLDCVLRKYPYTIEE